MRTALILLFLLALASVPGSVLPQEGIDPAAVTQYYQSHPALAPILNRLSLFSVFAAPWFAAIYLLLFAVPGRLRAAADASAWSGRPGSSRRARRATSAGCPRSRQLQHGAAAGRRARVGGRPARRPAVPAANRRRLGLGREGLPARGRQPAVPHRAARPAGLGRRSAGCSATRPTGCSSSARASPTRRRRSTCSGRAGWSAPGDLQPFSHQSATLHARSTSRPGRGGPAAGLQRRPDATRHSRARRCAATMLRVNHPLRRRRRQRLPDRPWLRADLQGDRRYGQGALGRPRSLHTGRPDHAHLGRRHQGAGRPAESAWLRRRLRAVRRGRGRHARVRVPGRAATPG